jgi:hypothetical protein
MPKLARPWMLAISEALKLNAQALALLRNDGLGSRRFKGDGWEAVIP